MQETWKTIPTHPDYEVSDQGRVRSKQRWVPYRDGRKRQHHSCMMHVYHCDGYALVALGGFKKARQYRIHRLMAETFLPNPDKLEQVNHKNCDTLDNRLENLEWMSRRDNVDHGVDKHRFAKLSVETIIAIHRGYHEQRLSLVELTKAFDVTIRPISDIVHGRRHIHVTKDLPKRPDAGQILSPSEENLFRLLEPESVYEVSTQGQIRRTDDKACPLYFDGSYLRCGAGRVHELVARTFVPNPLNHRIVHHVNGCKTDNRAFNLQWCTGSYNAREAQMKRYKGSTNARSALNDDQVREMRRLHMEEGLSHRKLAKRFGVSNTTAYYIVTNKTYVT